ncbi:hypothetical protein OV090_21280 [Nannocystis sp. RBIL2]|uniref:hypothetical protein n=1 Tax=Nannocystis sp. RBIL2 TaxID=2996788 RepID=UPI00226E4DBB|nr:hypothetical protein [Nannocystis sp. RBIL2]MCY1067297.1 hypothetical protein [Nannocystis sp. RBIL2]
MVGIDVDADSLTESPPSLSVTLALSLSVAPLSPELPAPGSALVVSPPDSVSVIPSEESALPQEIVNANANTMVCRMVSFQKDRRSRSADKDEQGVLRVTLNFY